jgi:hypothetical protein
LTVKSFLIQFEAAKLSYKNNIQKKDQMSDSP